MKSSIFTLKPFVVLFLLFHLFSSSVLSQTSNNNSYSIHNNIISECLTHELLFEQSNVNFNDITTFYILNHGVDLNIASDLKINNKSVVLINKGNIDSLNGSPYFLFHTLNIEASKAFARVYLTYSSNGEIKTSNVDISFIKNSGQWQIANNNSISQF